MDPNSVEVLGHDASGREIYPGDLIEAAPGAPSFQGELFVAVAQRATGGDIWYSPHGSSAVVGIRSAASCLIEPAWYAATRAVAAKAETKDTNPKDAVGTRKLAFSCLPWRVVGELALAMQEGALKYGRHNYRAAGVRSSVYFDACMRHLTAWFEGEDIDPDSGVHHVVKAAACLLVIRDAMIRGIAVDDRPPSSESGWLKGLNDRAADLVDRYGHIAPNHYTIEDNL